MVTARVPEVVADGPHNERDVIDCPGPSCKSKPSAGAHAYRRADGVAVVPVALLGPGASPGLTWSPTPAMAEPGAAATAAALADGVDVIYQGVLTRPAGAEGQAALLGFPDFLVRAELIPAPDGEPRPGGGAGHEVVDAKLARTAKGRAVAQTAFYSQLLADLQGSSPRWLHLALGTGEMASFKVNDFAAYERQTWRLLGEFIEADTGANPPDDSYPEPVEHCAICRWSDACRARRRSDDDLSLVAGMTRGQRRALKAVDVETRRAFAGLDPLPALRGTSREALERSRFQAYLQVDSEDAGVIAHQLLAPALDSEGELVRGRGLLALPEPAEGDLFFDIEGARYYSEDERGLHHGAPGGTAWPARLPAEDAPRGMEFLYDLHRLNVATSRARALAIIVASTDLVRVPCQTPRQMQLANALCGAWQAGVHPSLRFGHFDMK